MPTVLTKEEVRRVLGHLSRTHQLMAKLLYGSGLCLMECVRLRVKDIDFAQRAIWPSAALWMDSSSWLRVVPHTTLSSRSRATSAGL
ncbi:MAG: tyrosine-type recombinase/integrase [Anaerolineales bacterium]|nr:tyrosine-type recombinase/integrase [Anaerolineales bacterium]